MLVYTYVSSSGKESTFQWDQIQTPKMTLSFLSVFSLQLAFHDMYSAFHFVNPLTPGAGLRLGPGNQLAKFEKNLSVGSISVERP